MGMNDTPSAERVHIGLFGRRNAGKSSLINAITGQNLAIVSDVKGTTTDPVSKAMELLPIGPVVFIDTPGLDDSGQLGKLRVEKSFQMLQKTDFAILVVDATLGFGKHEESMLKDIIDRNTNYIVVVNKSEELDPDKTQSLKNNIITEGNVPEDSIIFVSARNNENIFELKELIGKKASKDESKKRLTGNLLSKGDVALLVVPIDSAAPKGRLILPQQQVIRDVLEAGAAAFVCRESELSDTLNALKNPPKIVITDSQAFEYVAKIVPDKIMLTSFSILFSRYKGDLAKQLKGADALDNLKDGDIILISEGCTHHRQCDDIGTVKLPAWIRKYTNANIDFKFTSGTQFPKEFDEFAMIVHCGGCTLNEKEMKARINIASNNNIPMTNYGMAIAKMKGILERSVAPFMDELGGRA